jgi:hypothetical protein
MIPLTDLSQIKEEMDLRFYKGNAKYPRTYVISKDLFLDWINANVTVSGGGGDSIYTANGTLEEDRIVSGGGNNLTFSNLENMSLITTEQIFLSSLISRFNSGGLVLDIKSGTILFQNYPTPSTQVPTPSEGQLAYNSTLKKFQFYNGASWTDVGITKEDRTFPANGVLVFDKNVIHSPELDMSADISVTVSGTPLNESEWLLPVTPNGFEFVFSSDFDVFGTKPDNDRFILYMRHHSPSGKILVQFPEVAASGPAVEPTWEELFDAELSGTKWPVQLTDTDSKVSRTINSSGDSSMGVDFNGVTSSDLDDNQLGSEALPSDNEFTLEFHFNIGLAESTSPNHQFYLGDANIFSELGQHIRLDNLLNEDRSLYNIRTNDGTTQTNTSTEIDIVANKRWCFQVNRTTGAVTVKYHDGSAWQTAHTANIGAVTDFYVLYRNGKIPSYTGGGQYFRSDYVKFYSGIIDPA